MEERRKANLRAMFYPSSVAVVGASAREGKLGYGQSEKDNHDRSYGIEVEDEN